MAESPQQSTEQANVQPSVQALGESPAATDVLRKFSVSASSHPLVGVLSVVGAISAWVVFVISNILLLVVKQNQPHDLDTILHGPSPAQQATSALIGLGILCALVLALVAAVLGLIGTIQQERSRVTGIIGLAGSALLLLISVVHLLSRLSSPF